VTFFIVERIIYWFHGYAHEKENQLVCYAGKTGVIDESIEKVGKIKSFALLNLFGDGLHNFLDGIVIMAAFLNGIPIGIVVSLGGVLAFFLSGSVEEFNFVILAFSGGGFLYLACTELMPELMKQKDLKKSIIQTVIFLIGLLLIIALVIVLPHE